MRVRASSEALAGRGRLPSAVSRSASRLIEHSARSNTVGRGREQVGSRRERMGRARTMWRRGCRQTRRGCLAAPLPLGSAPSAPALAPPRPGAARGAATGRAPARRWSGAARTMPAAGVELVCPWLVWTRAAPQTQISWAEVSFQQIVSQQPPCWRGPGVPQAQSWHRPV